MFNPNRLWTVVLLVFFAGCTSSRITSVWKSPEAQPKTYGKIMVVGMIREADRTLRQEMEAHLVEDLRQLNYNAFSSFEEYGPKALEHLDEQAIYNKLRKDSIDAVLTIVLLDKEKERYYVPGSIYYSPYMVYSRQFYGYYRTMWWRIESPGYYNTSTRYFWESNLYDLAEERLVCSVQTESFNPSGKQQLAHEYGQLIVQAMTNKGVLAKQAGRSLKAL